MSAKERFCFNCGESMGFYADYDQLDDCGKSECVRAAREAARAQMEDAHEALDRANGWGDYHNRW